MHDAEYLRAGTIENGEKRTFLYYQGELIAETADGLRTFAAAEVSLRPQ